MRALKYVVLPDEDAVEFQTLEAALVDELHRSGAPGRAGAPGRGRRLASGTGRSHGGRAVRGAALGERWPRHGPDRRRQRHPQLRDAPALPQRRHGRVLAGAAHPQGAAGGAGGRRWPHLGASDPAGTARPSSATERTRAPRRTRPGLPAGRAARVRGAATPRATSTAERTRARRPIPTDYLPGPAPGRTLHEDAASWLPNEPESGCAPTVTDPRGRAAPARTPPRA